MVMRFMNQVRKLHSIVSKVRLAKKQHGKFHVTMDCGVDAHTIVVFILFSSRFVCLFEILYECINVNASVITVNGTCVFFNDEPNVVSFFNDLQIRENVVEFPAGSTVVSR